MKVVTDSTGCFRKDQIVKPELFCMLLFVAAGLSIAVVTASFALELRGKEYSNEAKLSLAEARKIALKTYPGQLVSQELEKEAGGSGLRYSFVIKNHSAKHEVGVDAKTGAVLENSVEGTNPD
jgi:hypothetical protein